MSKVLHVKRTTGNGVKVMRDMTLSAELAQSKHKPHQGKRECARRAARMKRA